MFVCKMCLLEVSLTGNQELSGGLLPRQTVRTQCTMGSNCGLNGERGYTKLTLLLSLKRELASCLRPG